jgi:uncharacterized protein (DUF58 family)
VTTNSPTYFHRYLWRNYRVVSGVAFWLRRHLTWAGLLLLAGTAGTAALGADTNLAPAYQAFAVLFVLAAAAMVTSRFSRFPTAARRELPRFGTAGQPFHYKLVLSNPTRRVQRGLTVFETLADPRPTLEEFASAREPGEEKRNWIDRRYAYYRWRWLVTRHVRARAEERAVPDLAPRADTDVPMTILPTRRGVLRFEAVTVACPDVFGIFRSLVDVRRPESVLILPRRYALPALTLPGAPRYQPGGVTLASSIGESEEFISLREYRPGDPMRHIHWRSWAKTGKPIVKEFQDEFFVRHALVLDTFATPEQLDAFEEAVSVAASLACTIQTQESLLDLLFVGPQAFCFTAGRGVAHREQILEVLASVAARPDAKFAELTRLVVEHLPTVTGCICILLGWDEPRREFVRQLRKHDAAVMVFVILSAGAPTDLDRGPMADQPANFRVLETRRMQENLKAQSDS